MLRSTFFFLVQHSLWLDISIKILISLSNVLFALPLVTNLRIKDTLIQRIPHQDILPFSACPAVSASVRWHTRLKRASEHFFATQRLGDGAFPGSLGSVGGSKTICSLLGVFAQAASLCLSILHLPPHYQMRMETSSHAPLACSEDCVIACTLCLTAVCFYLSQKLPKRSNAGLQMHCIFSPIWVTAVVMQLL